MVSLTMKTRNILFIVEGETDEPDFLNKMFQVCFEKYQFQCWAYRTSLHDLVCDLYPDGNFDPDIDILLHLRSKARDEEERKILSETMHYTDIFLIFDFEPHYSHLEWKRIREMLEYYRHSDDEGKLLLNYPMMQSYKHLLKLPDDGFRDRTISVYEASNYKRLVNEESAYPHLSRYTYPVWMSICAHHLKKMNYILFGQYSIPDIETYMAFDQVSLFDIECEKHLTQNEIDVVNTAITLILEYEPVRTLEEYHRHSDRYEL